MASFSTHYAFAAMLVLAALGPVGSYATGGGQCSGCSAHLPCKSGLECAHINGRDICVMRMQEGGYCGDPCWDCAAGLVCNAANVCEKEIKTIGCGQRCDVPNVRCQDGTSCIEHSGEGKICGKSMGVGEYCVDPCWACQPGLTCGSDGRCEEPKAKECDSCIAKECADGLHCKFTIRGQVCVRTVHGNGECKHGCAACESGICDWSSGKCWALW